MESTGNGKVAEQEGKEEEEEEEETQKTENQDPRSRTHLHLNQSEGEREGELRHPLYFPFPSSSSDYARLSERQPRAMRTAATTGGGGGEIVEVQGGGHIVRATGRKDRHSKVCTAKGLRDRRVRLSAHTAIQFYDVQDRLGYDRPSKAVDWLIKNAKPAIDRLAQLPSWRPPDPSPPPPAAPEKPLLSSETGDYASAYGFCSSSSLLPPSLDSDSIADTIKSFFPMTAAAASASSSYHAAFGGSSAHAEDLSLSLQSFQDPIFNHQQSRTAPTHQALFACAAPQAFDAGTSTWPEPSHRAATWNLVQNQFLTQWGTLQSSNPPSIRAMADPIPLSSASGHQMQLTAFRPNPTSSVPTFRTAAAAGEVIGFSGYHIPARIQGGEEEHGSGVADAPPSASSASHH